MTAQSLSDLTVLALWWLFASVVSAVSILVIRAKEIRAARDRDAR